jgi:xylose isomerase
MQRTLKIQQNLNDQLKIAKNVEEKYPQWCAKIAPSIYEQNRSLLEKLIKANKNIR